MQHFITSANNKKRECKGFTLIELMVAVAILGVLAALAAPAFNETIKRYQANAIADELIASIEVARTEARRRGKTVFLSRHTNGTSDCPMPATPTTDPWQCWRILVDTNNNQTLDGTEDTTGNVSQVFTVFSNYRIKANPITITINRWGQALNSPQLLVYNLTDGYSGSSSQTLCLSISGRITRKTGEAACP